MIVLVINAGSSSVKFTCFNMGDSNKVLANGLIERIGIEGTQMKYSNHHGESFKGPVGIKSPGEGVEIIAKYLVDAKYGVLGSASEVKAIGHRVVSGGEIITQPTVVDEKVMEVLKNCIAIAPLHNPHNIAGIEACQKVFPGVPNVAVVDTAFHTTMPAHVYRYAIPKDLYDENKIRRYGAHGTSHYYVAHEAAKLMGKPIEDLKIITCHLGNGASMTAVDGGKCLDTSMGLTPLEGLIMGTRSGDIDPAVVWTIMKIKNLDTTGIDNLLNKQSGVLALADIGSSDMRDIEDAASKGHENCRLALDAYAYRVKKYIGAYIAALGGLDGLVFTAGIGENSDVMREMACNGLQRLGIKIDLEKNSVRASEPRVISTGDSPIKVMVIPTDEEQEIARQTLAMVGK